MSKIKNKELDPLNPIPLHYQLSEILKKEILDGNAVDSDLKIPTELELVNLYGVSRITVRKAIQTLVDEDLLVRERGKGTYLKSNYSEAWIGKLMGFAETMKAQGIAPGSKVLKGERLIDLPEKASRNLEISEGWVLNRVRYADKNAIALECSIYPLEIGIEFEKEELETLQTYRFIEKNLGILLHYGNQNISAVKADDKIAGLLNMPKGDPLLKSERITYSYTGTPIEYMEAYYHPDNFKYNINLSRK